MLRRPSRIRCCVASVAALEIVRADRQSGLSGLHGAPQHKVGFLLDQAGEAVTVLNVVAIAEENQSVGFMRIGVVFVPLARLLLKRDQQVVAVACAGTGDRAQHRVEKRIDLRVIGRGIFEEQQREGVGTLATQVRGVLVDLVVQLLGDGFHPPAGFLTELEGSRATPARPLAETRPPGMQCRMKSPWKAREPCRCSPVKSPFDTDILSIGASVHE